MLQSTAVKLHKKSPPLQIVEETSLLSFARGTTLIAFHMLIFEKPLIIVIGDVPISFQKCASSIDYHQASTVPDSL
ncbi:hypothetical protein [Sutcliffiella horikoshii]|uniref:hypothetical protein n=1 Tax=Sutcliffiella horikoshii TaxID=79883 RepID=UPI00384AA0F7